MNMETLVVVGVVSVFCIGLYVVVSKLNGAYWDRKFEEIIEKRNTPEALAALAEMERIRLRDHAKALEILALQARIDSLKKLHPHRNV